MGKLGTYLQHARDARGLDLREAAQQTRISYSYLAAIEREDFSLLPGEVFVKGFLKSYAKFLQVSEDEVMRLYGELKTPPPAVPASAPRGQEAVSPAAVVPPRPAAEERPVRQGIEAYLWGGALIVMLIAVLLVVVPSRHGVRESVAPIKTESTATLPLATTATQTVRPEKLYLEVVALEDLWVLVRTDASPQKKAVLRKGEAVTWSADERFLLSYGSVGAAKILLNGRELAINAPKGAPVRDLVITAAGIAAQKFEGEAVRPRKPKPPVPQTAPPVPPPQPADAAVPPPPPSPAAPAPAPEPRAINE